MSAFGAFQDLADSLEGDGNTIPVNRWLYRFDEIKIVLFRSILLLLNNFDFLPKESYVPLANILLEAIPDSDFSQWNRVRMPLVRFVKELRLSGEEMLATKICDKFEFAAY